MDSASSSTTHEAKKYLQTNYPEILIPREEKSEKKEGIC
jgi:hypothetical protein